MNAAQKKFALCDIQLPMDCLFGYNWNFWNFVFEDKLSPSMEFISVGAGCY